MLNSSIFWSFLLYIMLTNAIIAPNTWVNETALADIWGSNDDTPQVSGAVRSSSASFSSASSSSVPSSSVSTTLVSSSDSNTSSTISQNTSPNNHLTTTTSTSSTLSLAAETTLSSSSSSSSAAVTNLASSGLPANLTLLPSSGGGETSLYPSDVFLYITLVAMLMISLL